MCTVRAESIHIPMLRVRLSDSARSRWASTFHLSICSLAKLRIYDYQWLHLISTENPATNPNHQFDQVAECHVCSCFFHSLLSTFCVLTRSSPNPPGLTTSGLRLEPSLLVLLTQLRLKKTVTQTQWIKKQQKLTTSLAPNDCKWYKIGLKRYQSSKIFQNIPNATYRDVFKDVF